MVDAGMCSTAMLSECRSVDTAGGCGVVNGNRNLVIAEDGTVERHFTAVMSRD
jgi:hypothetical protein